MKTLRYVIVGFGGVARRHAMAAYQAALGLNGEVVPRLVGLMNRHPMESPLPGVPHFTDLAEMVRVCRPDFLDLCLPHHLRNEAVEFAAERGLPVYCEKPLAANLSQAEYLASIAREIPTAMAFEYRFFPAVALMKRHLADIGPLLDFRAEFLHDSYLLPRPKTWRMSAENGGGSLLDLGVHMVDLLAYILGPLTYCGGEKGIYFSDRNEVDEYGTLRLSAGGCTGTLTTSRIHATEGSGKTILLYGERGTLKLDFELPYEIRRYSAETQTTTILRADRALLEDLLYPAPRQSLGWYQDAHTCSLVHFVRFLYTGQEDPLIPDFAAGLAAQRVLAGILEENG